MADPTLVAFGLGDAISAFVGDLVSRASGFVTTDPLRSLAVAAIGGGGLAKYYDVAAETAEITIGVGAAFVAGRLVGPALVAWLLAQLPEVPL